MMKKSLHAIIFNSSVNKKRAFVTGTIKLPVTLIRQFSKALNLL